MGRGLKLETTPLFAVVSRTAHDSHLLAELPLPDEVLASFHSQRYAHRCVGSIDLPHHPGLDLLCLTLGEVDQRAPSVLLASSLARAHVRAKDGTVWSTG